MSSDVAMLKLIKGIYNTRWNLQKIRGQGIHFMTLKQVSIEFKIDKFSHCKLGSQNGNERIKMLRNFLEHSGFPSIVKFLSHFWQKKSFISTVDVAAIFTQHIAQKFSQLGNFDIICAYWRITCKQGHWYLIYVYLTSNHEQVKQNSSVVWSGVRIPAETICLFLVSRRMVDNFSS